MEIKLDWRKSAKENASELYRQAKELALKQKGALAALQKAEEELGRVAAEQASALKEKKGPIMKRKREWYERYRWFFTSGRRLVVAGRDAKQNDLLVAKVMGDSDLFFHADIQGAPATILIGGKWASQKEKQEAAQFAASHSSAWKAGAAAVDVYAVEKRQLSKHAQGGYVGAGGFAISGEREWFRATPLGLALGKKEGVVVCLPLCHDDSQKMRFSLFPGVTEKGEAAKAMAKAISASVDEILLALPSGKFSIKERS
ncbi:MAG: NFACT RNA binding domain-containing protein [Candidatus Micrarchaeota archaeon]|nr:NFACT RNA binding domain-containing protein [Candidatus Micrarchaeota archaeon]